MRLIPQTIAHLHQPAHRWGVVLLALWLLLSAQTLGLWHDSVHAFHEHTQVCDLVDDLGQPTSLSKSLTLVLPVHDWQVMSVTAYPAVFIKVIHRFFSRAPPIA